MELAENYNPVGKRMFCYLKNFVARNRKAAINSIILIPISYKFVG